MARKEKIETEVEFRPKGLGELKAKWADFAGDLLEPVVMLAAGATKAQAAWAGFRGILESRVLGPLGLVAGASIGFLTTTRLLVNQWRALGMTAAGSLERMTLQFRPLLGSLASAKERVKELQNFSVKTPFELDEIIEANKMLEVLTQGALSGEKGMTMLGDTAAVTGQALGSIAQYAGRLYDGLMSGRPVGEATMRLQEMGAITGTVRNQIESMQAANASGLEIWKVVEKQFSRNAGAMEVMSKSLEGLQSNYNDAKKKMEGGFSSGFLEGEKAGVESATKVIEAVTPVMSNLGKEFGAAENWWENWKLGAVKAVTSGTAFGTTMEWLIKGAVGLAAVVAGASTTAIAGFVVTLLKLMAGNKAAAQSAEYLTKVQSASIPATTKLVSIKNALQAASRANAAGMKAEAVAQLGNAAAGAKNLAATNGMVGAVKVGKMAMTGFGMGIRFVGAQLKLMALAMLGNPLVWFAAAVIGVGMAFSKLSQTHKEAREKLEGYQKATQAQDSAMKKQISEIRTMVDLRQAEAKILAELTTAYKELDAAAPGPLKDTLQKKVDNIKGQLTSLSSPGRLEKGESQIERDRAEREGKVRVRDFERDSIAAKGPEEALAIANTRMEEAVKLRAAALALASEEAAIDERAAAARQTGIEKQAQMLRLVEQRAKQEQSIKQWTDRLDDVNVWTEEKNNIREWLPGAQRELEKLDAMIRDLGDAPDAARLGELLASPSELQKLTAKIEMVSNLKAAVDALNTAQENMDQNTEPAKKGALADQLKAAKEKEAQERKLAQQAGVTGMGPEDQRAMKERRDELQAKRLQDQDPMRTAETTKDANDKAVALAAARLDSEAAIAALRLKGYEREEKLLAIERQKLAIQLHGDQISQAEYDRQEKQLAAREAALQKEGTERRDELAGALAVSKLRRAEQEANLAGDPARAARMRQAAEAIEDARARKEAERDAADANATPEERKNYVAAKMKEAQDARAADRKREEEERAAGRGRAGANQGSAVAAIEAERLRLAGKTKESKRVKEDAARKQDELDREENAKRYREQGFGAADAGRMATRDVKISQAERMMQEMGRGGGTVVASSLAKIGGGGNVAGTDPDTRLLERVARLLEQIRDDGRKDTEYDP